MLWYTHISTTYLVYIYEGKCTRMAAFTPLNCSAKMRVQVGTTVDGTPKLGTLTIGKVDPSATADAIESTLNALGAIISTPLIEIHKSSTDLVA